MMGELVSNSRAFSVVVGLVALASLLATPRLGVCEEMRVFIGTYRNIWDGTNNRERADLVAEKVFVAAQKAGLDAALDEVCADRACMERVIRRASLALAAVANVEAADGSYDITIELIPKGEGERFTASGALEDVLAEVEKRAVRLFVFAASEMNRVPEDTAPASAPMAPVEAQPDTDAGAASPTEATGGGAPKRGQTRLKRIAPVYFWTAFGVTAVLGAGWGALEITVHRRYKSLKDGHGDLDYWEQSTTLQIAARALFASAATAAATTFVMMFFTDFKSRRRGKAREVSLTPVWLDRGGVATLEVAF